MDVRQLAFLARQPSAVVRSRTNFLGLPKRGLALVLANAMFWQPLLAQAEGIVVSAPGTTLGQAGNGVPIVNIAAPNGSGLSHNQFKDYNVGANGVILNNATDRTQSTQLGGIIVGNPNFHGSAANVILNEVNGGSPSQLRGYTEVAGQSAHVIVANPYGISCNGCGFINTPQATLTTGKAVIENGQISRYQVDQGSVAIDGTGLNATNIDQFEIITRATTLNAQIQAKKLTIVAGRNDVDARTLNATARAADGSKAPDLAIDSSALGGMYVGAVKLVGTEAGVGVKLSGDMVAGGDIQIDAAGNVVMGQTSAGTAVAVKAVSVEAKSAVYAGTDLSVKAQGVLTNQQTLAAKDSITLDAGGRLTNNGIIEAGVNADNSRNTQGDVRLTAQAIDNSGRTVIASRDLTISAGELANQGGTLSAQRTAQLTATNLDNQNQGRILSGGSLGITADQLLNSQGGLVTSTGNLTAGIVQLINRNGELSSLGQSHLQVASLDNVAGLIGAGQHLSITASGRISNQGGRVLTDAELTLTSASLDNSEQGRIAGNGVVLKTGTFVNQRGGQLTSTGALQLIASQVDNSSAGRIASAMALTATVSSLDQHAGGQLVSSSDVSLDLNNGQLDNQGGLIAAPGQLLLKNLKTVVNQGGEITSAKAFTLAAQSLDNTGGKLVSDKALTISIDQSLANARGRISGVGVDLRAAQLDNTNAALTSDADLSLQLSGALLNRNGELSSAGNTTISAIALDNTGGQITGDQRLSLAISGAVDNRAGTLAAGKGLNVTAASLDNRQSGSLVTDGNLDVILDGVLNNQGGGNLLAKGAMSVQGSSLDNRGGRLSGKDLLTLHTAIADNRGGLIRADKDMRLIVDQLDNSQKGLLTSTAAIDFTGQRLNNQGGLLSSMGLMQLKAGIVLNDAGRIASQSDLIANVDALTQRGGELVAEGALTLTGATLDNRQGGLVGAIKALKLNVGDIDNRGGEISSQVEIGLTGDQLNNSDGGKVLAGTALGLKIASLINQNKGLLSSEGTLNIDAASLNNANGSLSSAAALNVSTTGALNNQGGSISTDAELTLNSATLDNQNNGVLSGKGATRVTTGDFDNSHSGRLTSANTLDLNAAQVTNQDAGRIASAMALTASVTGLDQQGGELFSEAALSLDVNHGRLNNQGGLINAPGVLLLKNLDGVANRNGEISSGQGFTIDARTLDNSGGKVLSNQALVVRLTQAMSNVKGLISASALKVQSDSLDNSDGLISSHDDLNLMVSKAFENRQGAVVADGNLLLSAATVDNGEGQIDAKKNLIATLGSLQQQGGQLIAQGNLSLTGNSLDNRANGLVGATGALNIDVGNVDNRGGELSSQGDLTVVGQSMDNSGGGQILARNTLALKVDQIINRNKGLLSGKAGVSLFGTGFDNTSGVMLSTQNVDIDLGAKLDNSQGLISSEGTLGVRVGSLVNTAGSLSSAGNLNVNSLGTIDSQGGQLVTDASLTLHSASLDNSNQGTISGKGAVRVTTGQFDNSHAGQLTSADIMNLDAGEVTNQDGGRIGSTDVLTANVTSLDQHGGRLFSSTRLDLDLNNGQLNNRDGLINAPVLVLKKLSNVDNRNGEISSANAFVLAANTLDNANGKLLSNQSLTLRIAQTLNNIKGMVAATDVEVSAGALNNRAGTLNSRGDLKLGVDGLLTNESDGLINAAQALDIRSADLNNRGGQLLGATALKIKANALDNSGKGLINTQGALGLTAEILNSSDGGEVSAAGDIDLNLGALTQNGGRLLGNAAIRLDLNGGDLTNSNGLLTTKGPLTISRLRDLDNHSGEVSSGQSYTLAGRTFENTGGKLISNNRLSLNADNLLNQNGLISGLQGLDVSGGTLDNRNNGTLSSRDADVNVNLSGALLNNGAGALVSQQKLNVTSASLDNRGGILSSGSDQNLTVAGGVLNNAEGGLIDSGSTLVMSAMTLTNAGGTVNAQKNLGFTGTTLDNSGGSLIGNASVTLDLLGALTNTHGKIASVGPLRVKRTTQIDNQGGQIASQGLLTLLTGGLDNRERGTVAANDQLLVNTTGAVQNDADGLIHSQNGSVQVDAYSLSNGKGVIQSQGDLKLTVGSDIDNQSGRIQAKSGDVTVVGRHVDNRGGVLASLQGMLTAQLTGVLNNGYDLNNNRQGGITQAQRLNLTALGGIDNHGGRISAQTGDVSVVTRNFDNRNGGLYAKGKVNVTANDFDNSGDNDGQIAGSQIDLNLTGDLNNRLGIIESDSSLAIKAASLDNQAGQLRALGSSGKTDFQIGGLFDNQNGRLESANTELSLGVGKLLNANGSVLHVGNGNFGISTQDVINAGGSFVTRGTLTLSADSWTNSSVLQAGTLNVNVNSFTQTASGQLLATTALTGSGGNWRNDGLIASDGTMSLTLSGTYAGDGRMTSLGSLTVGASQLNLSSSASIAGGATTGINVGGELTNYGRLSSAGDMTIAASNVANYGAIAASRDLTATAPILLNAQAEDGSRGFLFSGRDMRLQAGAFTNQYADVYSLGNLQINGVTAGGSAQRVLNSSGRIEAGGDISVAADSFVNQRDRFRMDQKVTGGYMTIRCVQHCDGPESPRVRGPVFIYQTVESLISADSPMANLISGRNLTVNSTDFQNQYSLVSAANDLTITSANITNKAALSASGTSGHEVGAGTWISGEYFYGLIDEVVAYNRLHPGSGPFDPGAFNQLVSKFNPSLFYGINDPVVVQADGKAVAPAIIQAGGAVKLSATNDISNLVVQKTVAAVTGRSINTSVYSATQPSVVLLNRQLPPDLSQQQVNPLSLPGFSLPVGQNGLFRLSGQGGSSAQFTPVAIAAQNWTLTGNSVAQTQRDQTVPDVLARDIQARTGSAVSATQQQLTADVRQGAGIVSTISVTAPADSGAGAISVPQHTQGTPGKTVVDGVTGSNLAEQPASPANQSLARVQGLPSSIVPANPHKYLVETNSVLTDLKSFMSSDYLLQNLGYDPDQSAKRLGDGLYEQTLVQQAVVARTGQAFISGQTSNEAQFRYLMDNAIASKTALNLSVGVSLTSEQVAALTHDIVWMESAVVDGETVLVPVLYLAHANDRLAPNGALIQGRDVSLIAGKQLDNVGTLKATNNLSVSAGEDLTNSGLMQAGDRLDLLAGNNVINKAGGILSGRNVAVSALTGDVLNERTVTSSQIAYGQVQDRKEFADNAARVEAANDLSFSAGRDINVVGGELKSGRDLLLNAGRDVNLVASQTLDTLIRDVNRNSSTTTQYGASVSAGRDISVQAGRDLNVVATQIDAKRDIKMDAVENATISSAADEEHFLYKSKKLTIQEDHVSQVKAEITAGGNVDLNAGKNLTMIASRIAAGDEAYLAAGDKLQLLAAQNSDYSLFDEKKKGSWGSKKTQRDEVTDVNNIGSEITTGGDLSLVSGGDQRYQVAKLNSGKDLTIDSGGSITFESVKDLHQESHEKSKTNAAWFSMKGEGRTDETVRQSELTAKGDLVISAVGKIHVDVRQVNKQTVSESINAMVNADPKLAWLKELDAQGGVDWRQVQEIHTSFKYANAGMGPAAQMIVAILMTVMLGPAGVGLTGASLAGAASLATTGAVATINNKGNIGAGLKAVVSKDGLTNAAIAAITANVAQNYLGDMTMTKVVNGKTVIDLGSIQAVSHFAGQQLINNASAAAIAKAFGRDVTLAGILQSTVYSTLAAYSFDQVGNLGLKTGSPEKIALHALVGGMIAEASGSDFAVGAMAAGVNETFANQLRRLSAQLDPDNRDHLMLMSSQLLGVVAAAALAGDNAKDLQTGSFIAGNATQYNNLNHDDMRDFVGDMNACGNNEDCQKNTWIGGKYQQISDETSDWSKHAVSGAFAKSLMTSIQGGLTALKDLNCTTGICEYYKDTLTARALNDLTNLAKVTDQWENATALAALVIPGYGGARGPGSVEGAVSPKVQKALDEFMDAKAVRGGVSKGKDSGSSVGGPDSEAGMHYNPPVKETSGGGAPGAKDTASGLVSGETGVVGNGKAAANDASFDGTKATATPRTPLAGPTENWKTFVTAEKQIQLEAGAGQRVDQVINETLSGKKNFTSSMTLTTDEALSAGQKYLGPEYREIGKPGSGVFHSADGTREFRIDSGSISGAHAPGVPHVHFGVKDPVTGKYISNNHVPYAD